MTEIDLIIDFHKDAERQGPGSSSETKKALDLIGLDQKDTLRIADIGCGSGAQTFTIAQNTKGHITAVDLFPGFLEKLNEKSKELGLNNRITTINKPMEDLPFNDEEYDIIWSEGAIYNMGFNNGIKKWRKFLKTGGYLAVTEISWITDSRPKEIEDYWVQAYNEIDTVSNKIKVLEKNEYSPIAHFILPQYCWIKNYYNPIQKRFSAFIKKHKSSEMAKRIIESEKEEIRLYDKYKDYYSYGFYIAKKL